MSKISELEKTINDSISALYTEVENGFKAAIEEHKEYAAENDKEYDVMETTKYLIAMATSNKAEWSGGVTSTHNLFENIRKEIALKMLNDVRFYGYVR